MEEDIKKLKDKLQVHKNSDYSFMNDVDILKDKVKFLENVIYNLFDMIEKSM